MSHVDAEVADAGGTGDDMQRTCNGS